MPPLESELPFGSSGTKLRDIREAAAIRQIKTWLAEANPPAPEGIGDDCAVIENATQNKAKYQLATTDALTLGRHFIAQTPPAVVGTKLVNRNLSDLAAMGGQPSHALLTILSGGDLSLAWLEGFIRGIAATAIGNQLKIVGGDMSAIEDGQFTAVLALYGTADKPALRTGARDGDDIWVTGQLGGSILGHHLSFSPRLAEARWLIQHAPLVSMLDLTDGLAKDLSTLLDEDSIATLDLPSLPVAEAARTIAKTSGQPALNHVFQDGEDYELLFTTKETRPAATQDWTQNWAQTFPEVPLTRIGKVASKRHHPERALIDLSTDLLLPYARGYEHF